MTGKPPASNKIGLITLGCPKNVVDSEEMLRSVVSSSALDVVDDAENAEVVVINTCAFIGPAKEESIETILEAVKRKQEGRHRGVVVAGCLSERYRAELQKEIPEVDAFLGVAPGSEIESVCADVAERNRDLPYNGIVAAATKSTPLRTIPTGSTQAPAGGSLTGDAADDAACHSTGHDLAARLTPFYTAYLKISEGCDNPCTFCAIPSFRGRHRSKPPEVVLAEAQELARSGAVELNVIAQDTTSYGLDMPGGPRLHEILPQIAAVDGIRWTRLLYAYPRFVTDELIDCLASTPGVLRYIDMPLQHASGSVLKRMGRGMDRESLTTLLHKLQQRVPDLVLRTTMMVGFPGETEDEFEDLLRFIADVRFQRLGAFTYSPEDGTPAFRLEDDVPEEVKLDRYHRLMELQQEIAFQNNEALVGRDLDVIIEAPDRQADTWIGRTMGDAPEIDGRMEVTGRGLVPGRIYTARVTSADGYDLFGSVGSETGTTDDAPGTDDGVSGTKPTPTATQPRIRETGRS